MKILFLHGLASSGAYKTADTLRILLKPCTVIAPDVPIEPVEAFDMLQAICREEQPDLIVGLSLGGFWAQKLRGWRKLLINPDFHIHRLMESMIGEVKYLSPRRDGAESFNITEEICRGYETLERDQFNDLTADEISLTTGFFGDHDEVVDCRHEFGDLYPHRSIVFPAGHLPTYPQIKQSVIPFIRSIFNVTVKMSDMYDEEQWSDGSVVDLRRLEGTNSYCSGESYAAISKALEPFPVRGIHWIDSGDYHYLSAVFMARIEEPFALVLIDNHSDDLETAFGEMLSCGSWVAYSRKHNPNLRPLTDGIPVYLSIDLDALSSRYVRTNWDQGTMSVDELVSSVRELAADHRIIGIDVCGGLTIAKGACICDLELNSSLRSYLKSALDPFVNRNQ